jgi:hypothetical protein
LGSMIEVNGEIIRCPVEDLTPLSHRNNLTLCLTSNCY